MWRVFSWIGKRLGRYRFFRVAYLVWLTGSEEHLDLVAAGVAFYAMLALFPGLAALVSLYGLLADPTHIAAEFDVARELVPGEVWQAVSEQLRQVAATQAGALGFGFLLSLLFTLWSATRGMRSFINALNIIHGVREGRDIVTMNLVAYGLTALMVLVGALAIAAIVGVPVATRFIGLDRVAGWLAVLLPWPVLAVSTIGCIALLYRIGPARNRSSNRRALRAATGATLMWLLMSLLFTLYVGNVATFNVMYGSLGAVVVLLLWFLVSAQVVLWGAVWNALPVRRRRQQPERADGSPRELPSEEQAAG